MSIAGWHSDPTGRHDTRRRNVDGTWSDEVADSGVLSRDPYDGTQPEPTPEPEPAPQPEPVAATDTYLPTIAAAVQQVQRWTGWLLAVVVVALAVSFFAGVYVGLSEPEPTPVILQYDG